MESLYKTKTRKFSRWGCCFCESVKTIIFVEKIQDFEDDDLECVLLRSESNLKIEVNLFVSYIPPGKDNQLKLLSDKLSESTGA